MLAPRPWSLPILSPTHVVFKGHVLSGHAHVGLGNARLDNHFPQELSIQFPAGEERRGDSLSSPGEAQDNLGPATSMGQGGLQDHPVGALTFAWPG